MIYGIFFFLARRSRYGEDSPGKTFMLRAKLPRTFLDTKNSRTSYFNCARSKRLISAATLSSPADLRARKSGAHELVNMAKTGVSFPQSAIVTTRSYIHAHPDEVLNFLRGYADGMQRMLSDKSWAKRVIGKYTRETDPEILESTYQYGVDYIAPIPYPAREGIAEILKQSNHPKARSANPDEFVDMSLVKKLDDGGFFRRPAQR